MVQRHAPTFGGFTGGGGSRAALPDNQGPLWGTSLLWRGLDRAPPYQNKLPHHKNSITLTNPPHSPTTV
eukprot:gene625-731_t